MTTPSYLEQKLGFRLEQVTCGRYWIYGKKREASPEEIALWNLLVELIEANKPGTDLSS